MIKQLDKHIINKIAAGEVVERPLSVVKELTENAVDAGSGTVTVEIKDGGLSLIRVRDNGSGIPPDEVMLAFAQHATSKITDIDDLNRIGTLGFRGEALASIASVSQVEMITKTAGSLVGTRVELHGGTLIARQELGCSEGTNINVSNLFFNTPARLKFLKKPAVEAGYVTDLMQRLALAYPGLAIRYISNGQVLVNTNGKGDLKTAVYHIYGRDVARGLISVEEDAFVSGYIGKPEIARGSRSAENFFINGRYIKCEILQKALEQSYNLPIGKFPLCVLHLQIPADQIDVNVHPAKMEVRFADERLIYNKFSEAISRALSSAELVPLYRPKSYPTALKSEKDIPFSSSVAFPSDAGKMSAAVQESIFPTEKAAEYVVPRSEINLPESTEDEEEYSYGISLAEDYTPIPASNHDFLLIEQIWGTYWLALRGDELYLIDQHAAHERILYEELLHYLKNKETEAQPLLEPAELPLSPREIAVAIENKTWLEDFGFTFECNENNIIILQTVPLIIKNHADFEFFTDILDKLEKGGENSPSVQIREELAMAACKSAVKARDNLSVMEARSLINKMLVLENPYSCPHGRPTMIKLSRREIERMFKRT